MHKKRKEKTQYSTSREIDVINSTEWNILSGYYIKKFIFLFRKKKSTKKKKIGNKFPPQLYKTKKLLLLCLYRILS